MIDFETMRLLDHGIFEPCDFGSLDYVAMGLWDNETLRTRAFLDLGSMGKLDSEMSGLWDDGPFGP